MFGAGSTLLHLMYVVKSTRWHEPLTLQARPNSNSLRQSTPDPAMRTVWQGRLPEVRR